MIPEVANVLLLLLEGHLIADGIGLVSHWGSGGFRAEVAGSDGMQG